MAKDNEIPKTDPKKARRLILDTDLDLICEKWANYEGQMAVFESAIGALFIGRLCGYDALRIIHSSATLRKYEDILGISFAEEVPRSTPDSLRINGVRYAKKFDEFWQALGSGIASTPGAKLASKA